MPGTSVSSSSFMPGRQLGDVDEPVHAGEQLDEHAEIGLSCDGPLERGTGGKMRPEPRPTGPARAPSPTGRCVPSRGRPRGPCTRTVSPTLAICDGRTPEAVRQLADVHHAVHAAEVHKDPEITHALDLALDLHPRGDAAPRLVGGGVALVLEDQRAGDHQGREIVGKLGDAEQEALPQVGVARCGGSRGRSATSGRTLAGRRSRRRSRPCCAPSPCRRPGRRCRRRRAAPHAHAARWRACARRATRGRAR